MGKAVLGVLVAVVCWVGGASAASVPELKATPERNGNVRVRWSFASTAPRDTTTLELERSSDGTTFAPLTTVRRARKRQGWLDRVKGQGAFWYRARVVTDETATGWSVVVGTSATPG